jgi:hypothetical protein
LQGSQRGRVDAVAREVQQSITDDGRGRLCPMRAVGCQGPEMAQLLVRRVQLSDPSKLVHDVTVTTAAKIRPDPGDCGRRSRALQLASGSDRETTIVNAVVGWTTPQRQRRSQQTRRRFRITALKHSAALRMQLGEQRSIELFRSKMQSPADGIAHQQIPGFRSELAQALAKVGNMTPDCRSRARFPGPQVLA